MPISNNEKGRKEMSKTKKRVRIAAVMIATSLAVCNTPVILNAEENNHYQVQGLVDECGYYVKVNVTADEGGHILSVTDNGTESPKSSEHFWNIFDEHKDEYFKQFENKTASDIEDMEIDAVSGATKSSNAAYEAVKDAVSKFNEQQKDEPNPDDTPSEEPIDIPSNPDSDENEFEVDEYGVLKEYSGDDDVAEIPEGVVEIDEYSFAAAEKLKTIKIPASVQYINPQAFLNCPNLTSFEVDEDNNYFYSQDGAIYSKNDGNKKLVMVPCGLRGRYSIADDVKVIGESAFYSTYLSSIYISKSVVSIDAAMIDHAVALEAINVDEDNDKYSSENGILYNKEKDELILVPTGIKGELHVHDGVKNIGEGAFYSCVNLTSVVLPEGIKEIPMLAFAGCISLKEVVMPESVTSIGDRAFAGTGSLVELTVPQNVSEFGQYVFANSTGLQNIYVEDESKYFSSIDGVLFTADKKKLVQYPVGRSGDYKVPEGTTCIGMGSFFAANFVEKVIVPDSVITFGNPDFPNPVLGSIVFGYFNYPRNLVLVGSKNSVTETYAKQMEINFEELSVEEKTVTEETKVDNKAETATVSQNTFVNNGTSNSGNAVRSVQSVVKNVGIEKVNTKTEAQSQLVSNENTNVNNNTVNSTRNNRITVDRQDVDSDTEESDKKDSEKAEDSVEANTNSKISEDETPKAEPKTMETSSAKINLIVGALVLAAVGSLVFICVRKNNISRR